MLAVLKTYDISQPTSEYNVFTDILVPQKVGIQKFEQEPIVQTAKPNQLAIDKAVKEIDASEVESIESVQSGEGVFDIATSVLKGAMPAALAWKAATTAGKLAGKLVTGKVGTKISNVLSTKFNKNPNWRPGFPGEAHLVLPTPWSLTRANYAGPGTNLGARLARGDLGVDGPKGIDIASKTHDMLYNAARTKEDIRKADNRLISDIRKSSAGPVTRALAVKMLQAKKFGENVGVFGAETFTKLPGLKGKGRRMLPAEMLKKKLRKQGYQFPKKGKHNLAVMPIRARYQRGGKHNVAAKTKRASRQRGGQLGFLASLAAGLVVPAIVKAFKKKKKKK